MAAGSIESCCRWVLTDEDRIQLARFPQERLPRLAERARIVLACAEPAADDTGVAV